MIFQDQGNIPFLRIGQAFLNTFRGKLNTFDRWKVQDVADRKAPGKTTLPTCMSCRSNAFALSISLLRNAASGCVKSGEQHIMGITLPCLQLLF